MIRLMTLALSVAVLRDHGQRSCRDMCLAPQPHWHIWPVLGGVTPPPNAALDVEALQDRECPCPQALHEWPHSPSKSLR